MYSEASAQFWRLFCKEHGLGLDGMMIEKESFDGSYNALFRELSSSKVIPRTIVIDSDPSTIDAAYNLFDLKRLIRPSALISGLESASGCFARGRGRVAQFFRKPVLDSFRREVECSDNLSAISIIHATDGG